jgi:hypothetical protein
LSAGQFEQGNDNGEAATDERDDYGVTHRWCRVVVVRLLVALGRRRIPHLSFHGLGRRFGFWGG